MTSIIRRTTTITVTIAASANLSDALDFTRLVQGLVRMPAAWTAASIGFKVSGTEGGTYLPLYDDDGALVQIDAPVASRAYTLPVALAGALWVKLWSQDGAASDTNQLAERVIPVDLKS